MEINDPRLLALALEDLLFRLERWSVVAADLEGAGNLLRVRLGEALERTEFRIRLAEDRLLEDAAALEAARSREDDVSGRVDEAGKKAQATCQLATAKLDMAENTAAEWQDELDSAKNWLTQARERLAEAEAELEAAESCRDQAESDLEDAREALDRCRSEQNESGDGRRNDCSDFAAAVEEARRELHSARLAVAQAEREVEAATEDEARASRRVACCHRALTLCRQAEAVGAEAAAAGARALEFADSSREHLDAGRHWRERADDSLSEEMGLVENCRAAWSRASRQNDEATIHQQGANRSEEAAQYSVSLGRSELERLIEQLLLLARPESSFDRLSS